jgi:hypothetical protein
MASQKVLEGLPARNSLRYDDANYFTWEEMLGKSVLFVVGSPN